MTYSSSLANVVKNTLSINTTGSTYVEVGEVVEIQFTGAKRASLDPTNFDSTVVEKITAPLADYGQVKVTCNNITTDAGHQAIVNAFKQGGTWNFKVQRDPDPKLGQTGTGATGDLRAFSGIITSGPEFTFSMTKLEQMTFTIDINSAITFTPGAAGSGS